MKAFVPTLLITFLAVSCSSYDKFRYFTEEFQMPSQIVDASYDQTWKAVLASVRGFDLSLQSNESGVIKTRWMDNTKEYNFADSFGPGEAVKGAQFRLVINVSKGIRSGREMSKVTIYRRQLMEQDFLQGWKEVPTDGIQERVLLYRIARLVAIDKEIKRIEKERIQKQSADF
jgi:hypothetical protein